MPKGEIVRREPEPEVLDGELLGPDVKFTLRNGSDNVEMIGEDMGETGRESYGDYALVRRTFRLRPAQLAIEQVIIDGEILEDDTK